VLINHPVAGILSTRPPLCSDFRRLHGQVSPRRADDLEWTMNAKTFDRIRLASLPTPLVRAERLGAALGGANIWIKRDDLTGLELSGNKVRKLEFVLADALQNGCDTIVTEGTSQSNHCRATAAACAKLGLKAVLLFRPPPGDSVVGNHLLDALFEAETRSYTREALSARKEEIIAEVLDELRAQGRKPRFTPAGASEPIGCLGYAEAARELIAQCAKHGIPDCDVVLAVSSGGTYAGLLLGTLPHAGPAPTVHAVPVSDDVAFHRENVGQLCRNAIAQFGLNVSFDESAMRFIDGYVGAGYAKPYAEEIEAIRLLAKTEGIVLDPVYTGKAFCALVDAVKAGRLGRNRPVIFIHTGGIFSDFAWPETLMGANLHTRLEANAAHA